MVAVGRHVPYSMADLADLEVAIVHYWMVTWRGGEKVVESILKLFPKADIYTLFYDRNVCGRYLKGHRIYTSCLDNAIFRKQYQKLFPLYPLGVGSLKLKRDYDLIISSESGPAKGIANPKGVPHLCYVHTPMRYCWGFTQTYLDSLPEWSRKAASIAFNKLRKWDLKTVDNVDCYVANSQNVVDRVKTFYGKDATVCYPPISLDLFEQPRVGSAKEHYLSFGALTPYKNIELLVKTFNQLDRKLIIVGEGSERKKLEKMARSNIQFMGSLPIKKVLKYMNSSRALLFPGEEDFGMVPLEVMSQGLPVIALKKGGALETVVENREKPEMSTGIFFDSPTVEAVKKALFFFESVENRFSDAFIRSHARKFGEDVFQRNISEAILKLINRTSCS